MQNLIVEIKPTEMSNAIGFANDTYEERYIKYKERDPGLTKDKCWQDIYISILSEYAARRVLVQFGHKISEVDLNIYDRSNKNFGPDLLSLNSKDKYCVKGEIKSGYEPSHLFEFKDDIFTKPCNNRYIISVSVDLKNKNAYINGCFKAEKLVKNKMFGKPFKKEIKEKKAAIYIDTVKEQLTRHEIWGKILGNRSFKANAVEGRKGSY
jgi:hypothetical protein